jgi:outer membrane receptor protein involved in Fe transport
MNDAISFSASFLEMVQYMHLLTKADIGLPGDIWVPATENVAPEGAKHVQIGTQIDLKKGWALSATAYYKEFENLVEFLGGDSTLVINALNYESNVTQGGGVSKGIEFSASKTGDNLMRI